MARILRQQRFTRQPTGTFPKLKREFADAVVVYLPSIGLLMSQGRIVTIATGGPTLTDMWGTRAALFNSGNPDRLTINGTQNIDFSASGFTALCIGGYNGTGGTQAVEIVAGRGSSGTTGGFTLCPYNVFGGTPTNFWSSYNNASTGDTNYDAFWVNGVKAASGNGNPATVQGTRYVFAAATASGPPASATTDICIGRNTGTSDSDAIVEMVVIWKKRIPDAILQKLTLDPYSIFQPPVRLQVNSIAGGVSAALTGVTGTGSVGTVVPNVDKALTGNTGTGSAGTVSPSTTAALTGNSATGSVGTVGVAADKALTGVTGTGSSGTVGVNVVVGLTGVTGTGSVGTVTPGIGASIQLTGVSATGSVGTVGVSVDKALSGVTGTGSAGTLTPSTSAALTGVSGTGSAGTVQAAVNPALSGVSGTSSVGTVGANVTVGLTGVTATGSVGTVTPSTGATIALTGVSGTGAVTAPGVDIVVGLTGVSAFGSVGNVSIPSATSPGGNAWEKQRQKRRAQVQAEVNRRNLEIIKAELAKAKADDSEDEQDDDEEALMLLLS